MFFFFYDSVQDRARPARFPRGACILLRPHMLLQQAVPSACWWRRFATDSPLLRDEAEENSQGAERLRTGNCLKAFSKWHAVQWGGEEGPRGGGGWWYLGQQQGFECVCSHIYWLKACECDVWVFFGDTHHEEVSGFMQYRILSWIIGWKGFSGAKM